MLKQDGLQENTFAWGRSGSGSEGRGPGRARGEGCAVWGVGPREACRLSSGTGPLPRTCLYPLSPDLGHYRPPSIPLGEAPGRLSRADWRQACPRSQWLVLGPPKVSPLSPSSPGLSLGRTRDVHVGPLEAWQQRWQRRHCGKGLSAPGGGSQAAAAPLNQPPSPTEDDHTRTVFLIDTAVKLLCLSHMVVSTPSLEACKRRLHNHQSGML